MKASRLLNFLIELTVLSRKHGVAIKGDEIVIDDNAGRYMVDVNKPGEGDGLQFTWVGSTDRR